ncbi:hypothetical protein HK097_001520 [Rhizophlyctis rosea]|uniref:NADH dehydrogenase [ubiquinone] 1 beta subcomplex subunit 9 n=1 Tax=Rhizophlyctis rosea TaxID=64517 RepID=A0AAD5SJT4_9FUNG|nr:hypothetical protein HK097_001520 [Rhizophlyctis rosea]
MSSVVQQLKKAQERLSNEVAKVKCVPLNNLSSPAHNRYVRRLYKRSLKLTNDWYPHTAEFRRKQMVVRDLFEFNRNVTNEMEVFMLLKFTEHQLDAYAHHQPYVAPYSPGGTNWERNTPLSDEYLGKGMTPFNNNEPSMKGTPYS